MAVRIPLKVVGSGASFSLQRCTAAEITQVVDHMIRKYGQSPSATLAVGSGNLGNITDSRLKAGAGTTDASNFDTTGELDDVSQVTVTLNKILGAFMEQILLLLAVVQKFQMQQILHTVFHVI